MKTAIYIEDGTVQLVITPESEFEKDALRPFSEKPMEAQVFSGVFYDCRGGWVRQKEHYPGDGHRQGNEMSLILRMTKKDPESAPSGIQHLG